MSFRFSSICPAMIFLFGAVAIPLPVLAQGSTRPPEGIARSAPQPAVSASPEIQPRKPASTHAFWDRTNLLLFSGVAVFRGLDYASTRNFQARGRTEILLAQDVVNNSAAFASVEAAGAATSVGISYLFHRTGHHKMERWVSIAHISVTAFGVGWNYSLESKRPH